VSSASPTGVVLTADNILAQKSIQERDVKDSPNLHLLFRNSSKDFKLTLVLHAVEYIIYRSMVWANKL
jgi:hypothetical protein